jgi:hypothetical protein
VKGTKYLVIALMAFLIPAGLASAQAIAWTRQFGASGFDVARAMAADEIGVYAFGAVSGALPGQTYAGGPDDVYLRKYDLAGNELWTRQFGTLGDDFSMAGPVAIDESAVYVAGWTDGTLPGETNAGDYDAFVRQYDTNGNEVWTDQFGGTAYDDIDGVAVYRGAVFVAGNTLSALPGQTSGGSWDGHVSRYDSDGNRLWTRQFGGAGSDDHHGVAADNTGVYVVGSVSTGPDFTGEMDVLVLKYDFKGNLVWVRQFGTPGTDHAEGIAARRGQVYVVGFVAGTLPGQTSAGGDDVFVRKYDPDGNEVWTRQFGTAGNDSASFRGADADGRGVYVTGNVNGTLPGQTRVGGRDAFVRQYSLDGDELWTLQFGTTGDDRSIAIAIGSNNDVYLGGRTSGAFPGFTYAGGTDAFVTKIVEGD